MDFRNRPGPINALCVFWVLYTAYDLYGLANANLQGMPGWFMTYYTGLSAAYLVGIAGIWLMRKWGLFVFAGVTLIGQVVQVSQSGFNPASLMLPLLALFLAWMHIDEMH